MIFGHPRFFAIESEVLKYYPGTYPKALGFFVIHLGGLEYGKRASDATMLGRAFGGTARRLAQRGRHVCGVDSASAEEIALAVNRILYTEGEQESVYLGLDECTFHDQIHQQELLWAPDGEEGFDDGSHVLQMDVGTRVRLVGFKRITEDFDRQTLRDVWIEETEFYKILSDWLKAFQANWVLAMSYESLESKTSPATKLPPD